MKRREFLKLAGAMAMPTIIPASVLGASAPSKKIAIGVIGCGRIAQAFNIPGCLSDGGRKLCDFMALSDIDGDRRRHYKRILASKRFQGRDLVADSRMYADYHALLADPAIDGVMITTPDHWHAQMAVEACRAKKDVFLQKPIAMTIGESQAILAAARQSGVIMRTGTQERATENFIRAVECVRDGRLGKVVRVEVGLPDDPSEPNLPLVEPVPKDFDYNMWLGAAPEAPYSQLRTHRRGRKGGVNFARPGWLTIQDYCLGMVTAWGAHHIDTAQRGLGEELGRGLVAVSATCEYPKRRLWNVHGVCDITWEYASGAIMKVGPTTKYPCGIRFIGEKGDWIFCGFGGAKQTKDDPKSKGVLALEGRAIAASKDELLKGAVAKPLPRMKEHNREWIEEMRTRGPMATPVEEAHRTSVTCVLGYMAMKLGRKLRWDAANERVIGDEEANKMFFRPARKGFGIS